MRFKLRLAKFQPFSSKETFLNWGLNERVGNLIKIGHILETVKDKVKVVINRKWHIGFQMTWKSSILDELEDH